MPQSIEVRPESIETRGAQRDEYAGVRDIFLSTWSPEDEVAMWDYLEANDRGLSPEWVRVTVVDGDPVSTATLLKAEVRSPRGWLPGAELTLVATHPEHRMKGYGARTVRDALAFSAEQGLALVQFYGVPEFYPRFGCVPVLPVLRTMVTVFERPDGADGEAGDSALSAARPLPLGEDLEPAGEADVPWISTLYRERVAVTPGALDRGAESWLWKVRNPEFSGLFILPDRSGYAFAGFSRERDRLAVREAATCSIAGGRRLLEGLKREAARRDLSSLHLLMEPENLLVRLAMVDGAEQRLAAPQPGFVCVTDWKRVLPPGYAVREEASISTRSARAAGGGPSPAWPTTETRAELLLGERVVLETDRRGLTRLVMGYWTVDDLVLAATAGKAVPGSPGLAAPAGVAEADLARLRADFPKAFPRSSPAPFFYWY